MKKNLIAIAAIATALVSCSSDDVLVENPQSADNLEIGFDTYTEAQTRAENSSASYSWNLEDHHTDFDVWSTKQVASNYIAVHGDGADNNAGVKVTWNTPTANVWNPASKKYWDKAATQYLFYAASPSSSNWKIKNGKNASSVTTTNYENAYLTYADFTLAGTNIASTTYGKTLNNSWKAAAADVDLMIAAPCTKTNISSITSETQTVTLQFNHILSRLNVAFKKSTNLDAATVKVTDFKVCNLVNKGSFDESGATAAATKPGTKDRWTPSTVATDIVDIQGVHTTAALSSSDAYYTVQSLVIPQNVAWESINRNGTGVDADTSKPYIYVAYTIDDEPYFAYINLAAAFGLTAAGNVAFTEGWQNNLTVTLDALEILFDATVSEWSTNEDATYTVQ